MCEPVWKGSMLGTVWAFSICVFSLFMPKLADKFGRKWVFKLTRLVDCILVTILIITDSYAVMLAVCIGLGAMTPGRLTAGVPYLNEWFPRKYQTMAMVGRLME